MKRLVFLAVLSVALLVSLASFATIPGTVSYQGLYTDNGGLVNGPFSFTFRLFDASSNGSEVWTESKNLTVTNSLFNTQLGDVTALPVTLFRSGATYWLEVTVGSTILSPRVEFNHYAGKAAYADTADVALSGTTGNELWSTDGTDVWRNGNKVGVGKIPTSVLDIVATTGDHLQNALKYETVNPRLNLNSNASGNHQSGIFFQKNGVDRWQLLNDVGGNDSQTFGIRDALANSIRLHLDANGYLALTSSVSNALMRFHATNTANAPHIGAAGDDFVVMTGPTTSEKLRVSSNGRVNIVNSLGLGPGTPWGDSRICLDAGSQTTIVEWNNRNDTGFLMYQPQSSNAFIFASSGGGSTETWNFISAGLGNLLSIGSTITMNRMLQVNGDLCVTGQKNAIVPTSQGMTKVYSEESAEVWFTDYGSLTVKDGTAQAKLDSRFLETVLIDESHQMMVFVTQTSGDPINVVVEKGLTSFTIRCARPITATFDYRVQAKRKDFADARLESLN